MLRPPAGAIGRPCQLPICPSERLSTPPALPQKQADDRTWLIVNTILDFGKLALSAYGAAKTGGGLKDIGDPIGKVQDIANNIRTLADPNLKAVMPEIVTTLKDTSPANAAIAWNEVSFLGSWGARPQGTSCHAATCRSGGANRPSRPPLCSLQAQSMLGTDPEKAKMLVDRGRLDTLLEQYMNLPAGELEASGPGS